MAKQLTPNPADDQTRDSKEIQRLLEEHELYEEYEEQWDFFLSAYDGGTDFAAKDNLWRHVREHPKDFDERAKRIYNENYCQPLVDFFSDYIFQQTIQRDGGSSRDFYNAFIEDVNRKGDSVGTFMHEVSDYKQIYGHVFAIVDAPRTKAPVTKRQEKQLKIRPYWIIVPPTEILDWVVDEFDNFIYVKRRQQISTVDGGGSKSQVWRFTEYFPDHIKITDVVGEGASLTQRTDSGKRNLGIDVHTMRWKITNVETISNPIGEIPVVMFRYKKSARNRFMGNSFLRDLAPANKELLNLLSLEQEFLYRQCYNILAMEAETNLPVKDQQEGEAGQSNTIEVPKGAKFPAYISPSAEPAVRIADRMLRIVNYMFRFAAQDTINELYNGQKQSGFGKAMSFSKTAPKIASRAETLQQGEIKLMRLTMKYMGKDWDGKIAYKDRYEITSLTDALTQLLQIFRDLVFPSPTFAKIELKRMMDEFDGQIPADQRVKIQSEIDSAIDKNFKEWQDKVLQTKQQSPSDQQKNKQTAMTTSDMKATSDKGQTNNATKKLNSSSNAS